MRKLLRSTDEATGTPVAELVRQLTGSVSEQSLRKSR